MQECNFFGYLSTLARPTEFTSQYEAEKYDEAVKKFAVYNEVRNIFNQLNEFTLEIKELYRVIEANNTSSNFFSRGFESDEVSISRSRLGRKTLTIPWPNITPCWTVWSLTPSGEIRSSKMWANGSTWSTTTWLKEIQSAISSPSWYQCLRF